MFLFVGVLGFERDGVTLRERDIDAAKRDWGLRFSASFFLKVVPKGRKVLERLLEGGMHIPSENILQLFVVDTLLPRERCK